MLHFSSLHWNNRWIADQTQIMGHFDETEGGGGLGALRPRRVQRILLPRLIRVVARRENRRVERARFVFNRLEEQLTPVVLPDV